MTNEDFGATGAKGPSSGTSDFNATRFMVQQLMAGLSVATLVQVRAVTNDGGLSPVGFVDVIPMVNQLDGAGRPMPHGVIHNVPYMRVQGGSNAVILDPQVGDIGMAAFADRDISSVKATRKPSNPGSLRKHDMADGLYLGGCLNGRPTQYVRFSSEGIELHSPQTVRISAGVAIDMRAPTIQQSAAAMNYRGEDGTGTAVIDANGRWNFTGPEFKHNGINVGSTHTHPDVQSGSDNSGTPNP